MIKRLLFSLLAIICQLGVAVAQDEPQMIKLTFDVDDASRIVIAINGEELENLQDGINNVEINPWSNLSIAAAEGCILKSITDGEGEDLPVYDNFYSKFIGDDVPEYTFVITTARESNVKFIIEVDNPEKVSCSTRNYEPLTLTKGSNDFELPESSFPIIIGPAKYGQELYSVTMDGEAIPYNYGYAVTPNEGSTITITADFPDMDCTVEFTAADGIKDFFTAIEVNSENVTDFANGITVICGDEIKLYFNQYCWQTADEGEPVEVSINGVKTSWFGPGYSFVVKDNTTVKVDQAVPVDMIPVTIDIDNPKNVIVYRCNTFFRDILTLSAGENTVELPKEYASIVIEAVEDPEVECKIDGVTINGRPKNVEYYNYMELSDLDANDKIVIYTQGFTITAIEEFEADDIRNDIYTMSGMRIISNATLEEVSRLPEGIYIFNGKKIMVK